MREDVINFIYKRFTNTNANWLQGNCYWFAFILTQRFPSLKIYYDAVEGHFIAGAAEEYYDWYGVYKPNNQLFLLDDIKEQDPSWYNRLLRDCIL